MISLVLDASASVDLLLDTTAGRKIQQLVPSGAVWWVPEHFFAEVAGVLRRAEIHGEATPARIAQAFADLTTSPLHRVQVRPLLPDAWAKRPNLTVADALYVVLAEQSAGLTQTELAARIGIAQSALSRIEAGRTNMTLGMFRRIAEALDVDIALEVGSHRVIVAPAA